MNITATHRPNIFSSVEDMDAAVNNHIYHNADKLSANYRAILKMLASYSLKSLGTSHLKYATISEQIGCSRVTVVRAIKRLKELGIIEVTKGKKLNGIQGADYFHILKFSHEAIQRTLTQQVNTRRNDETPRSSKAEHTKNNTESLNSFKALSNPFVKSVSNNVNACTGNDDLKTQLKAIYQPQSVEGNNAFDELCKIAFGRIKQFMRTHQVPYLQLEQIVIKAMRDLVRKQNVRNQFAMYSKMIERQVLQLFEAPVKPVQAFKQPSKELIPDWFEKRNEPSTDEETAFDFEAERQKILAKLG